MATEARVVITQPVVGICYMQVCAAADATDEEILGLCNGENPSGTTNGWTRVIREGTHGNGDGDRPRTCADDPGRTHFLVVC